MAAWTGIPSSKLVKRDRKHILTMPAKLKESIFRHNIVVEIKVETILRPTTDLNNPSEPMLLGIVSH